MDISQCITIQFRRGLGWLLVSIKINKPFEVEDRIEIDEYKGDVVNIKAMNFEILERPIISLDFINKNIKPIIELLKVVMTFENKEQIGGNFENYILYFYNNNFSNLFNIFFHKFSRQ